MPNSPDAMVSADDWSNLATHHPMPTIDHARLHGYRQSRLKHMMAKADVAMCVLVNPISQRYALDFRNYALFQAHIPTTYFFMPQEGTPALHGVYDPDPDLGDVRPGRAISFFDGGFELEDQARLFADDVVAYLSEIGADNRRVAVEYVNPSITQALLQRGLEVVDAMPIAEEARVIKSEDEIACIRWAVAVAELGISKLKEAIHPGVSELQLWALLNYANLANNGDWHDGRMLASGPRVNPWCQEASARIVEAGDLVGFDTDMIGPNGYFADISRTMFCGPGKPSKRQRELYRLAYEEVEYNKSLLRPGLGFIEFQQQAYQQSEEFHEHAYTCVVHGVGMCDEYPRVNPAFRGATPYDGTFEAGMVICVESFVGAPGERDGVKLEQQVLITENGAEQLSTYPYEEDLLG